MANGGNSLKSWIRQPGVLNALPASLFLIVGFVGPLLMVLGYSFMPAKTFSLFQAPTLENYYSVISDSYYISFFWSLVLAAATVVILFFVTYPIAYGMEDLWQMGQPDYCSDRCTTADF